MNALKEKLYFVQLDGSSYSRMDQVKFVEDSFWKTFAGPFLNTLTQIYLDILVITYFLAVDKYVFQKTLEQLLRS